MTNMKNILATAIGVLLLGAGAYLLTAQASTDFGNYEYMYITSASSSATVPTVVSRGSATLGSVVVASSSPANTYITVYDSRAATTGAQVIARIGPTAGTYTFDVFARNGIALDIPTTFNGAYTFTHRRE